MQLRLECYDYERDQAVAALGNGFQVKSVSKAYPNMRQTGVEGTPCENRYYITVNGLQKDIRDELTLDMLRFLAWLSESFGLDMSGEICNVRRFYDESKDMCAHQKTVLALEWKSGVLKRVLPFMKGGA